MARYLRYVFPVANNVDVCALQSTVGAANLVLNGNLADQVTNQVSFIDRGYSRSISLTSANDLSAATFTISGTQNGVFVTENVTGPNDETVYSMLDYDVITSIIVDGAVNAVSVGSGHSGFFRLIAPELTALTLNFNFSLGAKLAEDIITTTVYQTLDDIFQNGQTFANIVANNVGTLGVAVPTGAHPYFIYTFPSGLQASKYILIRLTGSVDTIANEETLIFLQVVPH